MTEPRPYLSFPGPSTVPRPPAQPAIPPRVVGPEPTVQAARIGPKLERLQQALIARRLEVSSNADESDPSLIVVFDLAGSVDDFQKAVTHIPGMEFLSELDEGKTPPDELFHTVDRNGPTGKDFQRTLQVVMTDAAAAQQLISLFDRWKANSSVRLESGLNPLKRVFAQLRDVRRWSAIDRIRESGLIEQWNDDLAAAGPYLSHKRVEIELWFRDSAAQRTIAESTVRSLIRENGGVVLNSTIILEAAYHALLVDIPIQRVQQVVAEGAASLSILTADAVMFVSPFVPMSFTRAEVELPVSDVVQGAPNNDPPRVALLDGLPIANHPYLAGRVLIDDPDDLGASYPISSRTHGTAMASLILHGDLNAAAPRPSRRIYARPILAPHEFDVRREVSKSDVLFPDLLHRAIRRIVVGENGTPAAAPSVRIINLSVGDESKIFVDRMSAAARVLDWLSYTYNLLIFVSAGNHNRPDLMIPAVALESSTQLRSAARSAVFASARGRGMLSPAEAINVLTVGALNADCSVVESLPSTVIDATSDGSPALYGALGLGYRRSAKPEIYFSGGRSFYRKPVAGVDPFLLEPASPGSSGPGHLTASPVGNGVSVGTSYSHGTSNAAALATRAASDVFDVLEDSGQASGPFAWPDPQFHPVVVKALLVHSARWGQTRGTLEEELSPSHEISRKNLTKLFGYGGIDADRAIEALSSRAVVVGAGSILQDQRQTFRFPMPADLRASTAWRRLTITLAWLSPVDPKSRKYRGTKLEFGAPPATSIGASPIEAEHWSTRMGTVQHQVFEGQSAVAFASDGVLEIDIDAKTDAAKLDSPVRFGLIVSIEVGEQTSTQIYDQVRAGLQIQAEARAAAQVRAR